MSLLSFYEKHKLTEIGLKFFKIFGANCYNENNFSKESFSRENFMAGK